MAVTDESVDKQATGEASGEIDLRRLLVAVLGTRKLVVVSVLIAAIALAGMIAMLRMALPTEQIFQHQIAFTFEGSGKGEYPNGSPFSINDILAPVILKRVFENNKLSDYGFKLEDLVAATSINQFSQNYSIVVARYQARLSDRKLSFAEREEIENNMQKELRSHRNKAALIRLTLTKRVGISKELGRKIVLDIPAVWAKHSIEQMGVLNLAGGFESAQLVDTTLFSSLDHLVAIDLLRSSAKRLEDRIEEVKEIGGAHTIIEEDSGHTLNSLRRAAQNLSTFKIQELLSIAVEMVFAKNPERTIPFFNGKLEDLLQKRDSFRNKADSTKSVMQDYFNKNRAVVSTNTPTNYRNGSSLQSGGTTIAQYGETIVDRIVNLTRQSLDLEFMQELTNSRLELLQAEAELNMEIGATRLIVRKISNQNREILNMSTEQIAENEKYIVNNISTVADELNKLWQVSEKMKEALSFRRLSFSGQIYKDALLTSRQSYMSNHPVLNRRVAILYVAALFIIALMTVFAGLLWHTVRTRKAL